MDFYFWTGLFAPKGIPASIVNKLNASFLVRCMNRLPSSASRRLASSQPLVPTRGVFEIRGCEP
jgi:hypothetical protein